MKHFHVTLMLFSLALPVFGQESPKPAADRRTMYEDIEVMRTILGRQLHVVQSTQCAACHVGAHGAMSPMADSIWLDVSGSVRRQAGLVDLDRDGYPDIFVANHAHSGTTSSASIEGSYLKGQGIVVHVTVAPLSSSELVASSPTQSPKAISDWEKTRRQIRGEKVETANSAKRATFADALLKTLAENGKNFSQLPDTESVTLVVTFRAGPAPAGGAGGGMMGAGMGMSGMGGDSGGAGAGGGMGGGPGAGAGGAAWGGPMGAGALPGGGGPAGASAGGGGAAPLEGSTDTGGVGGEPMTQDRELELLGDLHQKRGKWNEAASAFERALAKARESHAKPERTRQLVRKLAEVHLTTGNFEAARKALESAAMAEPKKNPDMLGPIKPAPAMKLPAKLIVSAPKKLLDQVGNGRISFVEFQQLANLEVLNFSEPAAPKK
jgi:tetratricopeptide (TPR) repeat protein